MKSNIELSALRALSALLADGSVSKAAERLDMSQPAMSMQLRRLRTIFNDPLLVRGQGGLIPTPRALQLQPEVEDVLQRADNLLNVTPDAISSKTLRMRILIVATDYAQHIVLSEIMERLETEAPHIHIDVRLANSSRGSQWMEDGEVDLGIGPDAALNGRMHFDELFRDRAVCVLGKRFFAENDELTLDQFCATPQIRVAPTRSGYFDQGIDRALERMGRSRQVVLTMESFIMVPRVVTRRPVLATLPARLLKHMYVSRHVWQAPLPLALPELSIGMYWHERTHRSPVHRWFRSLVRDSMSGKDASQPATRHAEAAP